MVLKFMQISFLPPPLLRSRGFGSRWVAKAVLQDPSSFRFPIAGFGRRPPPMLQSSALGAGNHARAYCRSTHHPIPGFAPVKELRPTAGSPLHELAAHLSPVR